MRSRTRTNLPPAPVPKSAPAPPVPVPPSVPSPARRHALVCAAIALVTAFAFAPSVWCGFLFYDDPGYVTENRHVLNGPTVEGARWAFTTLTEANWHPLTWLSLQLDAGLWGADPFGYHLTNVVLHALTAGLLFVVLVRMTGSVGRSAVVALLFAVHPLRVESVVWVSERKDVLSGLFWVLTMGAYAWYVATPSWRRMVAVTGVLALGLAAKPMLVTLPCVLVLLDVWPLGRVGSRGELFRRIREKWPLFALVAASAVVTFHAQAHGGAVRDLVERSVGERTTGAAVGYVVYLRKTVAPTDLAVLYSHPWGARPWWQPVGAVVLLGAITAGAIRLRRSAPYLLVGWFWYLGTLVPVIGLVQVGDQAYADRYTYIPHIGLFVAGVWGAADLLSRVRHGARWATVLSVVTVFGAVLATRAQIDHWRDDLTLWAHALSENEDNGIAHYGYAMSLSRANRHAEAVPHFDRAVGFYPKHHAMAHHRSLSLARSSRLDEAELVALEALQLAERPGDRAFSWFVLGDIARGRKRPADAAARYEQALELDPEIRGLRLSYARALVDLDRTDDAIRVLDVAIEREPNDRELVATLGELLFDRGRWAEAIPYIRRASDADPTSAIHVGRLAIALLALGQRDEAVRQARMASRLNTRWPTGAAQQAWSLATDPDAVRRDGAAAHRLAELACASVDVPSPALLDALAAACAEVGRYDEAVAAADRAIATADRLGQLEMAAAIRKRAELYRARQPYRVARP